MAEELISRGRWYRDRSRASWPAESWGPEYLSLRKREFLKIKPRFKDGWAYGRCVGTSSEGWIPPDYLEAVSSFARQRERILAANRFLSIPRGATQFRDFVEARAPRILQGSMQNAMKFVAVVQSVVTDYLKAKKQNEDFHMKGGLRRSSSWAAHNGVLM